MNLATGATIALASYLVGSISFSWLITKKVAGVDLRTVGSGNLGATNARRVLGRTWGLVIYLLDFAKGATAVVCARLFAPTTIDVLLPPEVVAGLCVILGHILPFYLRFRGGKGVATGSGVVMALSWPTGMIALLIWYLMLKLVRMVSAASIVASLSLPLLYVLVTPTGVRSNGVTGFLAFAGILVAITHRKNVKRILSGTEPKTGASA